MCGNNIRIYVIDYYPSSSPTLGLAAMQTGGKYYDAQFGIDNERVAREIGLRSYLNSGYDGDEDYIPDFYEEYGMICTNGNILFSDPSNPHSDNDGLMDGLEVEITSEVVRYIGQGQNLTLHYFVENSDPKKEDTDGDGINDNIDLDPLIGKIIEIQIDNGYNEFIYLNIENYFGGNPKEGGDQHWWYPNLGEKDYLLYLNDVNYRTSCMGCGLIAMSDLELYLAQYYNFSSSIQSIPGYLADGKISLSNYMVYVDNNREMVYKLPGGLDDYFSGVTINDVVYGLYDYLSYNGATSISIKWAPSNSRKDIIEEVRKMIHRNHPIVFTYFTFIEDDKLIYYKNMQDAIDMSPGKSEDTAATSHYATIVGYVKYYDGYNIKYLLKVVTNGEIFYVNYDLYAEKMSWYSNILEYSFR